MSKSKDRWHDEFTVSAADLKFRRCKTAHSIPDSQQE
jgi:hypothetical protein